MTGRGRLIVVCGLPGAGKTTLARQLATTHDGVRLCPDESMAERGIDLFEQELRSTSLESAPDVPPVTSAVLPADALTR